MQIKAQGFQTAIHWTLMHTRPRQKFFYITFPGFCFHPCLFKQIAAFTARLKLFAKGKTLSYSVTIEFNRSFKLLLSVPHLWLATPVFPFQFAAKNRPCVEAKWPWIGSCLGKWHGHRHASTGVLESHHICVATIASTVFRYLADTSEQTNRLGGYNF